MAYAYNVSVEESKKLRGLAEDLADKGDTRLKHLIADICTRNLVDYEDELINGKEQQ